MKLTVIFFALIGMMMMMNMCIDAYVLDEWNDDEMSSLEQLFARYVKQNKS